MVGGGSEGAPWWGGGWGWTASGMGADPAGSRGARDEGVAAGESWEVVNGTGASWDVVLGVGTGAGGRIRGMDNPIVAAC